MLRRKGRVETMEHFLKEYVLKTTLWSSILTIGLGVQTFLWVQGQLPSWFPLLMVGITGLFFAIRFKKDEPKVESCAWKIGSYTCTLSSLSVLIIVVELVSVFFALETTNLPIKTTGMNLLLNLLEWIPIGLSGMLSVFMLLMIFNGILTFKSLDME